VQGAATCVVEGWAPLLCTTEFSRAISPQAKGERTVASLLAKKAIGNDFLGNAFFGSDALRNYRGAGKLHNGEVLPLFRKIIIG